MMLPLPLTLLIISLILLPNPLHAALHPAKRQVASSIQDICGPDAPDCGSGYCCYSGQECISSSDPTVPQCRDLIFTGHTFEAFPYSYYLSLLNFDGLTSLGLTLSTFPTILPTTGRFTALPTYTDNVLPTSSTVPPTRPPSPASPTPTPSSTGAAVLPTVNVGVLVGGMVGVGVLAGV